MEHWIEVWITGMIDEFRPGTVHEAVQFPVGNVVPLAGDFPDVDQIPLRGASVVPLRLGTAAEFARVFHHVAPRRDVLISEHSPMMDLASNYLQGEPGVIRIDFAFPFDPLAHCFPT